ncbi:Gfo/Idh/MocA family protein [Allostreptomyces psammosilenae]|uniref:Putative dehydrogenase n=1 Tax=Allostreptomyces psammosilenae TaxID=1892865 RepID=A0A852ZZ50_9ACTN|nr:Gfo/Idh/MocA family oxidoreductase [Allostreptomyces psammosilenae]NYI03552.1 putative dehydrogenase [Allostreptomyces psammosilenae]
MSTGTGGAGEASVLRVGIVGLGNISGAYLGWLDAHGAAAGLRLTAVADLDAGRARAVADGRPGVRALSTEALCADPEVDVVLNLTIPAAHGAVAHAAIAAGKHVYGEKPLAADRAEAMGVMAAAEKAGVRVGCAPDTVLGRGVQTARAVVDAGTIGVPTAATAFMTTAGHERWHPGPRFYYQPGGGPLLDMGPYYLTALVHLLGPVVRVMGAGGRGRAERVVGSGPAAGTVFPVEVDTHVTGVLVHESGALSTVLMSFDVHAARLPFIEVYGTEGSVSVPDPNTFDGPVEVYGAADREWRRIPLTHGYLEGGRGLGLADLAAALRDGSRHRASGEVALHVLDIMESLLTAAEEHSGVALRTTCVRPEPAPTTLGAAPE